MHVPVFAPYSFYAMILGGARSLFRTVQLLRDDTVRCMFQFSHRTASTHNQKFLREIPLKTVTTHVKFAQVLFYNRTDLYGHLAQPPRRYLLGNAQFSDEQDDFQNL